MTIRRKLLTFLAAVGAALLWGFALLAPVSGQGAGATLSGTITDESGAAVPNATVVILNVPTGETRQVTSDSDGFYAAPNLVPGAYQVTVTANGFSTFVQKDITLNVSMQQTLNVSLHVGNLAQQLVVTAAPPAIQTSSS